MGLKSMFNKWRYKNYTSDIEVAAIKAHLERAQDARVEEIDKVRVLEAQLRVSELVNDNLREQLKGNSNFDRLLIEDNQIIQLNNAKVISSSRLSMVDSSVIDYEQLINLTTTELANSLLETARDEIIFTRRDTPYGLELGAELYVAKNGEKINITGIHSKTSRKYNN